MIKYLIITILIVFCIACKGVSQDLSVWDGKTPLPNTSAFSSSKSISLKVQPDTIAVKMLVTSDKQQEAHEIIGYVVYEFNNSHYLGIDKKRLPKNVTIWQSTRTEKSERLRYESGK